MNNSISSNEKASMAAISRLLKLKTKMLHLLKSDGSVNIESCEKLVTAHVKSIFDPNRYLFERRNKNLTNSTGDMESVLQSDEYDNFEFSCSEHLIQSLPNEENVRENNHFPNIETGCFCSTNKCSLHGVSNVKRIVSREIQETGKKSLDLQETTSNEKCAFTIGDLSVIKIKNENALRHSLFRGGSKFLNPAKTDLDSDHLSSTSKKMFGENSKNIFNIFYFGNSSTHGTSKPQDLKVKTGTFSNNVADTSKATGSNFKSNNSPAENDVIDKAGVLGKNSFMKFRYSIEKRDEKSKYANVQDETIGNHFRAHNSQLGLQKNLFEVKKIHDHKITVHADIHSHQMEKEITTGDNGHFQDNLSHLQSDSTTNKFGHGLFEKYSLKPGDLSFVKSKKKNIFDNMNDESSFHHLKPKESDDTLAKLKFKNDQNLQHHRHQEDITNHHVQPLSTINNSFKIKMDQVNIIHGEKIRESNNYNSMKHELISKIRKNEWQHETNTRLEKIPEHDLHHNRHVSFGTLNLDNKNDRYQRGTTNHHLSPKPDKLVSDNSNHFASLKIDYSVNCYRDQHFSIKGNIKERENHHHGTHFHTKNNIFVKDNHDHHLTLKCNEVSNNCHTHQWSAKNNKFGNDNLNLHHHHHSASEKEYFTSHHHNCHFSGKENCLNNRGDNNSPLWSVPCNPVTNYLYNRKFPVKINHFLNNYDDHHSFDKNQLMENNQNNHKFSSKNNQLRIGPYDDIEFGIKSEASRILSQKLEDRIDRHHVCPSNCHKNN